MRWTYYKDPYGEVPAKAFVDSQPPHVREKIFSDLQRLARFGLDLSAPFVEKASGGKLWGLKTVKGEAACWTIYFCCADDRFVLLHGFEGQNRRATKDAQKKANERRRDYLKRAGR